MAKKEMIVTLRYDNKEVGRERLPAKPDEKNAPVVMVGRADTCALKVPKDDASVSREHAKISFSRGAWWIEDNGSLNGVVKDGKKIEKPARLKDGDTYFIGRSVLFVSVESVKPRAQREGCDRLRFLDGPRAGEDVEIRPGDDATGGAFTIGSDPSNDLVLKHDSVSRRHLKLRRGNSGWFVQDLGSRNGTMINDETEKLTKERFLQHRDRIRVAYYTLMYVKYGEPDPKPILTWRSALLLMLLLVVGAVVYVLWPVPKPEAMRKVARSQAESEQFALALTSVDGAYKVRGGTSDTQKPLTDALGEQIREWQKTDAEWMRVRKSLSGGNCGEGIMRALAAIRPEAESQRGNWDWNDTTAKTKRKEAQTALALLKTLYDNAAIKRATSVDREELNRRLSDLDAYLRLNGKALAAIPFLKTAVSTLNRQQGELKAIQTALAQVDAAYGKIASKPPELDAAIRILEPFGTVQTNVHLAVRREADGVLKVCREFEATVTHLKSEETWIADLDFARIVKGTLPLPSVETCAEHPAFSSARDWFQSEHERNLSMARTLAPMVRGLVDSGVSGNDPGELMTRICDGKVWDSALSFDCFHGAFPMPSREFPNGAYDEFFGIKTAYEGLRKLPAAPDRLNREERNFMPKAIVAAMVFNQVKTFRTVLERPEAKKFRTGRLGELYALASRILEMREELVAMLRARQAKGGGTGADMNRQQIVAGYYAEFFSEAGEESYANLRALESAFKKLEKRVMALDEERKRESDPERRIKLRDELLAIGLPGNGAVREAWIDRVNGGGE